MSSEYDLNIDNDQEDNEQEPGILSKIKDAIFLIPRKVRIVGTIALSTFVIVSLLTAFQPQAKKRPIPETVVRVDVIEANRSSYPIIVNANGTIEAETRGNLVAQIRGEIVSVSDNFKTGGTFKKGDVLIQIDPRDYQADLSGALANLSQADAAYRQEQANAKQARQDWERLGNTEPAPDLVLRKPQLTAAKAQLDSARATHETAKLNLSRTTITAPYDGRIIQRNAVLGQYVGIGTPIAEVFATEGVEVRLPISQEEFNQLGLDQFTAGGDSGKQFDVVIGSTIGHQDYRWQAEITRTDSTFDINTRQIDVIAVVDDPFGKQSGQPALKIGQFVSARIQGRTVDDIYVIPNKSIREGSYIYTVRDEKLEKQSIDILWQDDQNALISEGVGNGELVVTTSLNSTLAGARAKLDENFVAGGGAAEPEATSQPEPVEAETAAIGDIAEAATVAESETQAPADAESESVNTESQNADAAEGVAAPAQNNSDETEAVSPSGAVETVEDNSTADLKSNIGATTTAQ